MDWREAMETEISRRGHERWRALCDESHPDHLVWRRKAVELVTGEAGPSYPSLATQAGNAIGALGRVAAAVLNGEKVAVDQAEQGRRLEICRGCPEFVAESIRCLKCGCNLPLKTRLRAEHCPLPEPKW